jgi:antitoxin YefM
MDTLSYTAVRKSLAETMDRVCEDHAPVIITRQNASSVVMLSLADYRAIEETAYLLRSPANASRLAKSIAALEAGKAKQRKLVD